MPAPAAGSSIFVANNGESEAIPVDLVKGSIDVGEIVISGVQDAELTTLPSVDGADVALRLTEEGRLHTNPQCQMTLSTCESITEWTVLNDSTINLATTTNHVFGVNAIQFDKVSAGEEEGGVYTEFSAVDLAPYHKGGGFLLWSVYISDVSAVDYVALGLGTNASNYNEWQISGDNLSNGWNSIRMAMVKPSSHYGNGWDHTAVAYMRAQVIFDNTTDVLADIAFDHITANSGAITNADVGIESVSSTVITPDINVSKVAGTSTAAGAGAVTAGTQRIILASDDPAVTRLGTNGAAEAIAGSQAAQMRYIAERALELDIFLDEMNVTTNWAVGNADTTTLATTLNHVSGVAALSFAKIDGAANSTTAYIEKTITTIDASELDPHDLITFVVYLSDLSLVSYAFMRVGTDASNYAEWRISDVDMTAAEWNPAAFHLSQMEPTVVGNGADFSAITYIAVGVEFDAETNALSDIRFDVLALHTAPHSTALLGAEIVGDITSPTIRVTKVGSNAGGTWPKDSGVKTNGTPRIVIATDDINLAAINKATGGQIAKTIDSYTVIKLDAAANGALQNIVDAPGASKQIHVMLWQGSPDTADGSIKWHDQDDVILVDTMEVIQKVQYGVQSSNPVLPVMIVATDKALELTTVTCGFAGNLGYMIVSV